MPEKDITEKLLEEYNDVFADIINVLLFNGRQIVSENELEPSGIRSQYKTDGKIHEIERDVSKIWRQNAFRIAFYGLENQTEPDADMPLRIIAYDGNAYRAQLLNDKNSKTNAGGKTAKPKPEGGSIVSQGSNISNRDVFRRVRYPVISLVLYFGYERHWRKYHSLLDTIYVPEEIKPFVNDYKINLFEIAWLSDEQVQMFKSDFRIVADYFVQMRKNHTYEPPPTTIRHVHELLQLMSVMTQDNRFEEVYNENQKGECTNMCEVLDRIENRGIERGTQIGLKQGTESMQMLVRLLMEQNRMDDLKKIAEDDAYCRQLLEEYCGNAGV